MGSTFGLPAVTFEAPGERLAAQRLHLPLPPSLRNPSSSGFSVPITHVYHNADPIPQGACTGFGSPCAQAGYALETRCHLGKSIVLDTVQKLGWKVDVRRHAIRELITNVLEAKGIEWGEGRELPLALPEVDCVVSPDLESTTFHFLNYTLGVLQVGIWRLQRQICQCH